MELSCSAGIATYPADAEDASSLCQLADGALYWAKRRGKRRTRRFDPEHVALAWTDQQAAEIAALLAEPEAIKSVFQPVVDLASGHLVGYEALARFSPSPGRSPEAWFAQAHGCGLGPELDAAAIRAALEPVGRPIETHLALNVSPSALTSEAVVRRAARPIWSGIVIEITEHEFVPDDETLAGALSGTAEPRRPDRDRRRRRRLRRAEADDAGAPRHRQARPRPDQAHPCRSGQDGAGGVLRPLRGAHRRDRVRRGDREPRRPGRRSATSTSSGDRATCSAARRRRGRSSRRSPPGSAGRRWPRPCAPDRPATESGSPPATAGSSTSAPGLPALAPARTWRARWP